MQEEFIKFGRLASRLKLPKAYLRRLVKAKKIPFLDMGHGRLLFKEQAVRDAVERISKQPLKLRKRTLLLPEKLSKH